MLILKMEMFLQKQQKSAATLSLPLWNSKLLVTISGRAEKFFVLKRIFLLEKKLNFEGCENAGALTH